MKRANLFKRLLCFAMVVAMLSGYAVPAYAADNTTVTFEQVDNSAVSATIPGREPVELPEMDDPYADTDVVRVSIVLEKAGTIEAGYSTMNIAKNKSAMNYNSRLEKDQANLVNKIEKATKEDLDVVWNLTLAANIISANVKYGQIEKIEEMAGVKAVVIETQYLPDVVSSGAADPNMATSGEQIGSAGAWAAGYTGAGSRIAIIDTGTDTDHQSFNAAAFEYSLAYRAGKAGMTVEEYKASLDLLDAAEIDAVAKYLNAPVTGAEAYINSKLPYGYNYVDGNFDVVHDNDSQGSHGSHVAGIATSNAYIPTGDGFANALDTVYLQGVAPDAQLITMKVFGKAGGAYDSDYMAAIEDAIYLGCDAVNLSLGSGNPGMSRNSTAEYQAILDSLVGSGVVVAMSAGNSGYWSENAENGLPYNYLDDVSLQTDGSPGSFTNSFAVASVDNDGFTAAYFDIGGNIVSYAESAEYGNAPMTTIGGTYDYVFVNAIGEPADFAAVGEDVLKDKVVLCYRGTTSFFEKANAAVAAGAKAVVIVNNQDGVIYLNLTGYEYSAPVVSVTQADGELFKAYGTQNTTESGLVYWTGTMEVSDSVTAGQYNSDYYTMSSFSSWGVPGSLELKPEITAPGGSIYSINGVAKDGKSYEVMSGTSMASPQVAGMAAVMAQYVRESGLADKTGVDERALIQSLLMSTAEPLFDANSGGNYYPVIQQGAGLANVGAAVSADSYIMMNANATASYADGKVKAELGDDPEKNGVYTFSFTINNLTDEAKEYALSADFFTQDCFTYSGIALMDTWTANLNPAISWTVDGKPVDAGAAAAGLDFNGDGVVNNDDGQALLDYATGVNTELHNEDKADLDSDGDIDSFDAYKFFFYQQDITVVPANGSVKVTVTATLSNADRELLSVYPNGAYIEGYVYAKGVTSDEGVVGTNHSIPVLAFYGNWSDASMFDKGSAMEYFNGLENRPPYLYTSNFQSGNYNGLTVTYADMDGEYWFGGNPMVADETYMPERNAISAANGSAIASVGFTAIRNAATSFYVVRDVASGEFYAAQNTGAVDSAYYYVNGGTWENTYYTLNAGFVPKGIPEDTAIEVGIMLVPEYYLDYNTGNVDVAALGKGAYMTMPMVVDNTVPTLDAVAINLLDNTLDVTVTDNQYVAAVALYDIYGQYLYTYDGSKADAEANATVKYALDLSEVNGPSFLLQVYDYAMNTTTYKIETQIGEVVDYVESIELSDSSLMMAAGSTKELTVVVLPVNTANRDVIWASSNDAVATVDENGVVTAVAAGNAVITATAEADETMTKSCAVTVVEINSTLYGVLQDAEGNPMQFSWDLKNDSTWTAGNAIDPYIENAAWDSYRDTLFIQDSSTMLMYQLDPATGETIAVADAPAEFGAPCYDIAVSPLFGDTETSYLFGVYGGYVLGPVENLDNTFSRGWNLASYLATYTGASRFVAICDYGYDYDAGVYSDVYLALDNSGTLWTLYYDGTSSIGLGFIPTDLNLPYTQYSGSQYCSLISDMNGDLYLSHFNGSTNEIYYLTMGAAGFESMYVGNVGADVWPAALYMAEINEDAEAAQATKREFVTNIAENATMVAENVEIQQIAPIVEESASGSLNSVANYTAPVRPMSDADVEKGETAITVTVTAKDASGKDVYSTNGIATVEYDAAAMTLVSVDVLGDYESVITEEGSVKFGYVALNGIDAGDAIAVLTFTANNTDDGVVTVSHQEANNAKTGYEETVKVVFAHQNTTVVDAVEATCTEAGYTGDTYCADCGKLIAKGEVIPAKGHSYEAVVTAPTCTEGGYTTYTCACGDSYVADETEALGHSWNDGEITTEPTCTEAGVKTFTCTVCGETYTEEVPAKGHTYEAVVTDPTCTEAGYITYTCACGESYVVEGEPATGHTAEVIPAVAPTCTETGLTEGSKCSVCGEILVAQEVVDALGHTAEVIPAVAPTCTETGLTEGSKCSVCGEILVAQEVVDALGHTVETVPGKDATCDETGLTEGEKCSVCGEILTEQEEIPATGHKYVDVVTKPTKTEKGYTTHTCENCGHSYVDSYTDPTPDASADTGDAFNAVWMFVMVLSLAGAAALVLNRKKFFN